VCYRVLSLAITRTGFGTANFEEKPRESIQGNGSLAGAFCGMNAIEIARQLNRDAFMVSRLCASYEAVRDLKTEKKNRRRD
jgi:hypothetical protein